jgi:2-dehydro-3-deoxyphosphogluconate aldolase/(4S)-4-hydroxy-2-oxoglutarate aldolase
LTQGLSLSFEVILALMTSQELLMLCSKEAFIEVTLNSPHALAGINELRNHFSSEPLVGTGTVRTANDVVKTIDAGASYLITPCLDLPSITEAKQQGVLLIPGIFTASKAPTASVAGCQTVKLCPADNLGPSSYLKALRAPLDCINFIPTGGVDRTTVASFHQAGAVAFGVGSAQVKNVAIDQAEFTVLAKRAKMLHTALNETRVDLPPIYGRELSNFSKT